MVPAALLASFLMANCVSMSGRYDKGSPITIKTADINGQTKKNQENKKGEYLEVKEENRVNDILLLVLIKKSALEIKLYSPEPLRIYGAENFNAPDFSLTNVSGNVFVNGVDTGKSRIEIFSKTFIRFDSRQYRGTFIAVAADKNIYLINRVTVNEYLYGVLPSEVAPSWPEEILKAQAVAARTFALYGKMNIKNELYDLESDVMSQVYKGAGVESELTNRAVDATENEIMTKDGKVVQAFFHSNSGGKTASSAEVWGGKLDYLESVDDPYCRNGKHYNWEKSVSRQKLAEILAKNNLKTGEIYDIKITDRTESGRVKTMKIYGSAGTFEVKGKDFRAYA
ncbi:MAG TPA: SpoIID/LytB domain-containing protein, partial [Candidatus Goldiibacteriota bacterium]|nr:SpoIID/LytB domain-containing protein [Candidatus Goldiibacteriota bacterium]